MRPVAKAPSAFLAFGGEAPIVSRTGYITAFARALSRRSDPPEIANDDHLADVFLLPVYRLLNRTPRLARLLFDLGSPGGVAYFNARTRHIDAIVREQIAAGLDQLVVLGAGFDSRAMRFDAQLGEARVFEVDVADVIALKERHLAAAGRTPPPRVTRVAIDFSTEHLDKLLASGFRPSARTLFIWEGVAMYLRDDDVSGVLRFVGEHGGPGSTLVFDYVTRAFFDGDHSGYGSRQLARGWQRMGNVNRSAIASVVDRLAPFDLTVLSDVGSAELELRYSTPAGQAPRRVWEAPRIAHARVAANRSVNRRPFDRKRMRARIAIGCALVLFAGCGGKMTAAPSDEAGSMVFAGCREAASLDHAGPNVRACTVSRELLRCVGDAGLACMCTTGVEAGCLNSLGEPVCEPTLGFACQNLCGPTEYAVQCGGAPLQVPATDQVPPAACRPAAASEELTFYCCPCE